MPQHYYDCITTRNIHLIDFASLLVSLMQHFLSFLVLSFYRLLSNPPPPHTHTQGEAVSDKQLRDDLMTMLVAGHETTAALLTWSLFEITKARDEFGDSFLERARAEVRDGLFDGDVDCCLNYCF